MIFGVGTDVVQVSRIARLLEKFGEQFLRRVFSDHEVAAGNQYLDQLKAGHFAKRFAAKEAFVKALGTGFTVSVRMNQISVENDSLGKPEIVLLGSSAAILASLGASHINLSLSDDGGVALAFVVIEAL